MSSSANPVWFALCDDEKIVPLGRHGDCSSAVDAADALVRLPVQVLWLFSEHTLRELRSEIDRVLPP